ncbi:MAG: lysoplasmalogenase [Anaerolineales bacterium]|nr:lysoplasmalogenase [Anaerolineales bacterium]
MSWLFIAAGMSAVLNWYAVGVTNKRLEYIAKPLTLVLLLAAYAARLPLPPQWWEIVFGLGLLFSLGGDVFLMLPGNQFVMGLASFLLAQVAYVIVFNIEGVHLTTATILMAVAIGLIAFPVIGSIVNALKQAQRDRLIVPVIVYGLFLGLMFWSAAATLYRPEWTRLSAGLMAFGGAAFFLSDSVLAWDRFVKPINRARLLTMITYHSAQFALTFGQLLHLGYL